MRGETDMASFKCKDLGMDCNWSASGKNESELLVKIADHAKTTHNIATMDDAMMKKVKQAIKR
jgi:predicted small metal-binding protein